MEFWKNVLWSDVTKLEIFGPMDQWYVCCKNGNGHKQKNTAMGLLYCMQSCNHDCMKDIDSLKYQAIFTRF